MHYYSIIQRKFYNQNLLNYSWFGCQTFNNALQWTNIPAKNEYDGEQRHQFEQVLADVRCHDSELQEVEEEEGQGLVDKVLVHRHFSVYPIALVEGRQDAVAQPSYTLHHHTCRGTRLNLNWFYTAWSF